MKSAILKFVLPGLLAGLCLHLPASAQTYTVSGSIRDSVGEAIPFASVYVQGSSRGATANESGDYTLRLEAGDWALLFKSIGFRQEERQLPLRRDTVLNVILRQESLRLDAVQVSAGEDPAYAIMRKAISRRKFHLQQEGNYTVKAYMKGLQRMEEAPEKFLGMEVRSALELDSSNRGLLYLSETESELFVKDRETYKEIVHSSRVAGDPGGFSINQASEMLFSFYENLVLEQLNNRGFVSPLADNALFYYRFRFEGSFRENGFEINKIAVIPKRAYDPVFTGYIYIVEDSWRIHSLDLDISPGTPLNFVDSLNVRQSFQVLNDSLWMPQRSSLHFRIGLLKFRVGGYFLTVFNEYRMPFVFDEDFFGNEILRMEKDAAEKAPGYWEGRRPVPLTAEERKGYLEKDSLARLKESEAYLDSVDAENNRFKPGKFVFPGYSYTDRFRKQTHQLSPMLTSLQFNTVEGLALNLGYRFRQELEGKRNWWLAPRMRYGFSNRHFNPSLEAGYEYSPLYQGRLVLRGGMEVADFNEKAPVHPLVNTIFTLAGGMNLQKVYERRFVNLFFTQEVLNGLTLQSGLDFARRLPLVNTNYFSFRDEEDWDFTANDPLVREGNEPAFAAHHALSWELRADLVIGQRYKTFPGERWRLPSPWPGISLLYRKGIPLGPSDLDYDFLSLSVYDRNLDLGLLGRSAFSFSGGKFLNRARLYYMDAHKFAGNTDIYAGRGIEQFYLLNNYAAFADDYFLAGHLEHNLEGFLLNKLPLIRRLKLREVAGLHYLHTERLSHYWELFLGIQTLGFRAGWAFSWNPDGALENGFRIGLGL